MTSLSTGVWRKMPSTAASSPGARCTRSSRRSGSPSERFVSGYHTSIGCIWVSTTTTPFRDGGGWKRIRTRSQPGGRVPLRKKSTTTGTPISKNESRFDRFSRADLIDLLEASMMRNGELFRGLSHSELDQEWILSQLEMQTEQSLAAIRVLQRKLALQTF